MMVLCIRLGDERSEAEYGRRPHTQVAYATWLDDEQNTFVARHETRHLPIS